MAKPSHFPTKMTLAHVYALLNSIPGVILVLESEGVYYVVLENIHTQVEGYWNSKGNRVLSAKILNTKFQYETNWNFQKGEGGGEFKPLYSPWAECRYFLKQHMKIHFPLISSIHQYAKGNFTFTLSNT